MFGDGPLAIYLREHLRLLNHKTTIAANEGRAVNAIIETHPDLIILCTPIGQMLVAETGDAAQPRQSHPIEILARAYGL